MFAFLRGPLHALLLLGAALNVAGIAAAADAAWRAHR